MEVKYQCSDPLILSEKSNDSFGKASLYMPTISWLLTKGHVTHVSHTFHRFGQETFPRKRLRQEKRVRALV